MSVNKKYQPTHIIPPSVRGKVFSSFSQLGTALGFSAEQSTSHQEKKCRKCGTAMRHVPGTNVWVCDGMVEKEDGGKKKLVPCGNRAMTSAHPVSQSPENSSKTKQKNRGNHRGKPAQAATA